MTSGAFRAAPGDSSVPAPHTPGRPLPVPAPWVMVLPLGVALALVPPLTSAAAALATIAGAALLTRPRWAVYLLAATVPYQSLLSVKVNEVSVSITEGVVALLGLAWLAQLVSRRTTRPVSSPLVGAIAALVVCFSLTIFVADNLSMAAKELLKWIELALVFLAGSSLLETPAHRRTMLAWLLGAGATEAIVGLVQAALHIGPGHFMIGGIVMRAYGTFEQPNPFGGYIGLIVPLAVSLACFGLARGRWRRTAGAVAILCGVALALTFSRGAWVAQIAALLLVILVSSQRARRALAGGAIFGTALLVVVWPVLPAEVTDRATSIAVSAVDIGSIQDAPVTPENWAVLERLSQWYAGSRMFLDNPVLGVGIGNYNAAYDDYRLDQWPVALGHAHNHYLTIAAEAGLVGLVAYIVFWIVAFRTGVLAVRTSPGRLERAAAVGILGSLTAFATHNLFDVLFVHGIGVLIGVLLMLLHGIPSGLACTTIDSTRHDTNRDRGSHAGTR